MRAILFVVTATLALSGLGFVPATAQDDVASYSQVDLRNGGTLFGRLLERGERVRLLLEDGDTIDLPASQVERVREVRGSMVDGRFFRADPNETRLFFGPTARTIPAGDAYLGVFELYLPFLAYGVTDRITLAGGAPLVFGDDLPLILYLAPKLQLVRTDQVTASVGSLSFLLPDEEESLGVVYAVATAESGDGMSSFTFGGGWGYAEGEVADDAVIMLGGDLRTSRSIKLLSENYFFTGEDIQLLSFGLRFVGERLSADLGLALPVDGEIEIALPLVNFVYSF